MLSADEEGSRLRDPEPQGFRFHLLSLQYLFLIFYNIRNFKVQLVTYHWPLQIDLLFASLVAHVSLAEVVGEDLTK